jgi:pyruvate dehydrogenase E1 component
VLASAFPHVRSYDPAFAFELAIIIQYGLQRMLVREEDLVFYITLQNEPYEMPNMPKGVEKGIIEGMYLFKKNLRKKGAKRVQLLGSGSIMMHVLGAAELLRDRYNVDADVWSVTSYNMLRREALDCERFNTFHPTHKAKVAKVTRLLEKHPGPVIAASDYMMMVPDQIARWVPGGFYSLGTDGFGRSDTREALRRHFEVDAECITVATLRQLADRGDIDRAVVAQAIEELGIDPNKPNPAYA